MTNCNAKIQAILYPVNRNKAIYPECILSKGHEGSHYYAFQYDEQQNSENDKQK